MGEASRAGRQEAKGPQMRQEVGGPGAQPHSWPHTKAGTGTTSFPGWPGPLPASRPMRQPRLAELMAGFPWAWVLQPRPALHLHYSPMTGTESRGPSFFLKPATRANNRGTSKARNSCPCGTEGALARDTHLPIPRPSPRRPTAAPITHPPSAPAPQLLSSRT